MGLRVLLAVHFRGYIGDQMIFISWMDAVNQTGLAHAYQTAQVNYPPIYLMILDAYGHLMKAINISVEPGLTAKIPGIVLDGVAMLAFFFVSRSVRHTKWRLFIATFFCLNPAIFFDSAVWGQVDILDGILVGLAVYMLSKRAVLAGILWSLAILSKFESIVVLPVLGVYTFYDWMSTQTSKRAVRLGLGILTPLLIVFAYLFSQGSLLEMIQKAYIATTGEYPYLSMNAMNIWFDFLGSPGNVDTSIWFAGMSYKSVGLGLLFLATLFSIYYFWNAMENRQLAILKMATWLAFSFYMLPTEIHERYILMAVILSVFVCLFDKSWILLAMGLTLTGYFNLLAVNSHNVNATQDMWMVYLNIVLLVAMAILMWKMIRHPRNWRDVWHPGIESPLGKI